MLSSLILLVATAAPAAQSPEAMLRAEITKAIEATCFDYLDGQLEGNPARVARALHPDLAKRQVVDETEDEKLGLRRMSKDELVDLTKEGALKTPREKCDRSCKVLDISGNAAVVKAETPWFLDYFHVGQFGKRWVIVNALWYSKPRVKKDQTKP
jgi:hypothetical protein